MTCEFCFHNDVCHLKRNHYCLGKPMGERDDVEEVCHRFKDKYNVAEIKNMKWRPRYYVSALGSKMLDGWICSVCGKHSIRRRETCDGCNSTMWTVNVL